MAQARPGGSQTKRPGRPARRGRGGPGEYDRRKSPEERAEAQRDHLLAVATEVFDEQGFANTTVADIVQRAHVSRQTFYAHFDDLRDALKQVYTDANERLIRHVGAASKPAAGASPLDRLRTGVVAYLSSMGAQAPLARVLNREVVGLGPEMVRVRDEMYMSFARLLNTGIADAHAQGLAKRAPCELTSYMLVVSMAAAAMHYIDRGEQDRILDASDQIVELVVRAYM